MGNDLMGRKTTHDQVQELLPWFVNQTLEGNEGTLVLRHLKECHECRRDRDYLQQLQREVVSDAEPLPNYRFSYEKLMTRIEAMERNRASLDEDALDADPGPPWLRPMGRWLSLAGAAATVVLGVYFAGVVQLTERQVQSEDFRALTLPVGASDGVEHRVALRFEDGVDPETVRSVLIETRSTLVTEPDENGTYIVEISVPVGMSEAEFIGSMGKIDGIANVAFLDDVNVDDRHEADPDNSL